MITASTAWVACKFADFFWMPGAQPRVNETDESLEKDGQQTGTLSEFDSLLRLALQNISILRCSLKDKVSKTALRRSFRVL
jgi:hypothetical protein